MKKILLSIAAVSAVAAAALPAAAMAQSYRPDDRGGWDNGGDRIERLDRRIDRGLRDGSLSRREAWRLKDDLRETARLQYRYSRDGMNGWERADLDRRFDRISAQIHYERQDRDYGYGYGPGPGPRW